VKLRDIYRGMVPVNTTQVITYRLQLVFDIRS